MHTLTKSTRLEVQEFKDGHPPIQLKVTEGRTLLQLTATLHSEGQPVNAEAYGGALRTLHNRSAGDVHCIVRGEGWQTIGAGWQVLRPGESRTADFPSVTHLRIGTLTYEPADVELTFTLSHERQA